MIKTEIKPRNDISFRFMYTFAAGLMLLGFAFDSPATIYRGMLEILVSPSNLLTDYMSLSGIGATFFNSGLVTMVSIFMVQRMKLLITGPIFAGIMTVSGFSFFGKDIFNSIPIMLGCLMYARFQKAPYQSVVLSMLFGTTLAPVVSFIAFGLNLPVAISIPLASLVGGLVGFILPPISTHFLYFHQGFNLYNVGFTAGVIATGLVAILRMFNITVELNKNLYMGDDRAIQILLIAFCLLLILTGFIKNGRSFQNYGALLKESGRLASDYIFQYGDGLVLINMGLNGLICQLYVVLSRGVYNGPVLGGIFTVLAFSAFGKHPRNIFPVLVGIFIANHLGIHSITSTGAILSGLFGTCLAPITGYFGWVYGVIAGFVHAAMVNNISFLHGGLNLYNNGFSGGFVAAVLAPIFDMIVNRNQEND